MNLFPHVSELLLKKQISHHQMDILILLNIAIEMLHPQETIHMQYNKLNPISITTLETKQIIEKDDQ